MAHRSLVLVLPLAAALAAPAAGAAAEEAIRRVVDAAEHPWLRWPRLPDYQPHLRALYGPRGYAPLWLRDGRPTPQAAAVIASLFEADARGLSAADYDAELLRRDATQPAAPENAGLFDAALTVAAMRYVSDSYIGRVDPKLVGFGLDVEPKQLDLPVVVTELASGDDPAARLRGLDPPFPFFARLRAALADLRGVAEREDLPRVPELPRLAPGDHDAGLPPVRRLLRAYGDLPAEAAAPADPTLYDPALVAAVKRFQERHGRDADGVIGRATASDLRVPPRALVEKIALAMERLRWLPDRSDGRFIVVNVPEYRLRGFEGNGTPAVTMNVVVGSAARRTETPITHADMRWVVFRPYWDIPAGIAQKEILPHLASDPDYLARHNMERVGDRVRQRPGRDNSLGLVKFIFPNAYHVYLHDTPAKDLFGRRRRDFSHGCIRVADPVGLAEFLLGWDRERILEAMNRGRDDHRVNLETPVPVYLLYSTVVVGPDGRLFVYDDIYGHDARLATLLRKGYPYEGGAHPR